MTKSANETEKPIDWKLTSTMIETCSVQVGVPLPVAENIYPHKQPERQTRLRLYLSQRKE
jgi:hypothetical protein